MPSFDLYPLGDVGFFHDRFKFVDSNIQQPSGNVHYNIEYAIKHAEVFLLCESEPSDKYQRANSELISRLWDERTKVFTSYDPKLQIPYVSPIVSDAAEIWDQFEVTQEERQSFFVYSKQLMKSGIALSYLLLRTYRFMLHVQMMDHLKELYLSENEKIVGLESSLTLLANALLMRYIEELRGFPFFDREIFAEMEENLPLNVSSMQLFLQRLIFNWDEYHFSMMEFYEEVFENYVELRMENLTKAVMKAHIEGASRIFLIAGTPLLKEMSDPPPRLHTSMERMYDALVREKIPFVTVKPTNRYNPRIEEPEEGPFCYIESIGQAILDMEELLSRNTYQDSPMKVYNTICSLELLFEMFSKDGYRVFDDIH